MSDLISRQAAIKTAHLPTIEDAGYEVIRLDDILTLSSAQPERKRGKWLDIMVGEMPAQACNQCNTFYPLAYTGGGHRYCPNCGADMRGEEE